MLFHERADPGVREHLVGRVGGVGNEHREHAVGVHEVHAAHERAELVEQGSEALRVYAQLVIRVQAEVESLSGLRSAGPGPLRLA
jgi:hypothetical protein